MLPNFEQYRNVQISTATKGQLLLMLYDGAIKSISHAIINLDSEKPDIEKAHKDIIKSQDIVAELIASLNMDKGEDIAKNLLSLYIYFKKLLIQANVKKESSSLKIVKYMLSELRSSWVVAIKNVEKKNFTEKPQYSNIKVGSLNLKG